MPSENEERPQELLITKKKLEQTLAAQLSRHDTILEMIQDYSDYSPSVRFLLRAKDRKKVNGIVGAAASLMETPEEYILAIQTALGDNEQVIVVEKDKIAWEAISYLQMNKMEDKIKFISLNVGNGIRVSKEEHDMLSSLDGFIGWASNLVDFEEAYQKVFRNILGHVIVVSDQRTAAKLAKKINYRYRIVTLAGEQFGIDGTLQGGSILKSKLLLQKHTLNALSQDILSTKRKLEQLDKERIL